MGTVTTAAVEQVDPLVQSNSWEVEQQADPDIKAVKRHVEQGSYLHGTERSTLPTDTVRLLKQYKKLCVWEGVLCHRFIEPNTHEQMFQIVCPAPKREVWRRHHETAAHPGTGRTLTTLRRRFFWVDMEKEVQGFQSGCAVCSLQKDRKEPRAPFTCCYIPFRSNST